MKQLLIITLSTLFFFTTTFSTPTYSEKKEQRFLDQLAKPIDRSKRKALPPEDFNAIKEMSIELRKKLRTERKKKNTTATSQTSSHNKKKNQKRKHRSQKQQKDKDFYAILSEFDQSNREQEKQHVQKNRQKTAIQRKLFRQFHTSNLNQLKAKLHNACQRKNLAATYEKQRSSNYVEWVYSRVHNKLIILPTKNELDTLVSEKPNTSHTLTARRNFHTLKALFKKYNANSRHHLTQRLLDQCDLEDSSLLYGKNKDGVITWMFVEDNEITNNKDFGLHMYPSNKKFEKIKYLLTEDDHSID